MATSINWSGRRVLLKESMAFKVARKTATGMPILRSGTVFFQLDVYTELEDWLGTALEREGEQE